MPQNRLVFEIMMFQHNRLSLVVCMLECDDIISKDKFDQQQTLKSILYLFFNLNMSKVVSPALKSQNKIFGIVIIGVELGILFAYGYSSRFATVAVASPLIDHSSTLLMYTFTALLAILGYGLLLAYSDNSAVSGLTTTLIVLSLSVQGTPLLLQFWNNVFAGFGSEVHLSLDVERQTMALVSSLLLSFAAFSGRLMNLEILLVTIFYNIGWTLSFKVTQYIHVNKGPAGSVNFDDYGTNYVYVFAGVFALFFSILVNVKRGRNSPTGSRQSAFISMIGTGFIFACFPFTGIFFPNTASSVNLRNTEGPMNIYFALTASVISTYIFGAIFGKFKMGIRDSIVGVISGGVTIAVVASVINNIGACIAIGAFSGFISALYLRVIHNKSQFLQRIDHLGIIGPITICSIFGGLALSPILYASYKSLGTQVSFTLLLTNDLIYYQLVNIGIAFGTAMVSGLIAGIFPLCFRKTHHNNDFNYSKNVGYDFGLYNAYDQTEDKKQKSVKAEDGV